MEMIIHSLRQVRSGRWRLPRQAVRLDRRGFVLLSSLVIAGILLLLTAVGLQRSTTELRAAQQSVQHNQAFQLAEGGVEDAYRYLKGLGAPPAGIARFNPFGGPRAVGRGQYAVEVDPDDNNPTSFEDYFTIESTASTTIGQVTRRVTKIVATESFARYSYFTDRERSGNNPIWFTSRDRLTGPVHSNDRFNISGSPTFNGPVSSAAPSINYANPPPTGGNNPAFNEGLTLNAPAVSLPNNLTKLRVAASSGSGLWLTGNTTVVLQPDGTMRVTNSQRGWNNTTVTPPSNGAIFVNGGNATVSGTLNGRLTIGATRDVVIADDIVYADDPRTNPDSDDILGLASEQNVVVSRNAPPDLTVQASLMALNSSFTVENWWQGPPKGTLTVYGGIIQDSRGAVSSFNSATGQLLSGYAKDYWYDPRFSDDAPPFFPTNGVYRLVFWQQN